MTTFGQSPKRNNLGVEEALSATTSPFDAILNETVIAGGYCVGCGACAAIVDTPWSMKSRQGQYVADYQQDVGQESHAGDVCPFSPSSRNENEIADRAFPSAIPHSRIGRHEAAYAGAAKVEEFRLSGSSGGLTSWFLRELLDRGDVNAVVHVGQTSSDSLSSYVISCDQSQLLSRRKSQYYPAHIADVMNEVRRNEGKYAFVGVPCVIRAVRNLMERDDILASRLAVLVGIFCGHMKATYFAEALGAEVEIPPEKLKSIDFRLKQPGVPASQYAFQAEANSAVGRVSRSMPMRRSLFHDWGLGWFRLNACEYCDDVTAETADISFGDAWLPQFVDDWRGTNIVVCRDSRFAQILLDGRESGQIELVSVNAEDVAKSQQAGLSHRREGLAYRLWLKDKARRWRPQKRVDASASPSLSPQRKAVLALRTQISALSIRQFERARTGRNPDLWVVFKALPWLTMYFLAQRQPRRVLATIASLLARVAQRVSHSHQL